MGASARASSVRSAGSGPVAVADAERAPRADPRRATSLLAPVEIHSDSFPPWNPRILHSTRNVAGACYVGHDRCGRAPALSPPPPRHPLTVRAAGGEAIRRIVPPTEEAVEIHLRILGLPRDSRVQIRDLRAKHLGRGAGVGG